MILKSHLQSLQVPSALRKLIRGLESAGLEISPVQITNIMLALIIKGWKDYTGASLWIYH